MGSRSRPRRFGQRDRNAPTFENSFCVESLRVIEKALSGPRLSWDERATLWTKLPSQLPRFCELYDMRNRIDGFIMVLHRLGSGQHLEFFDRDILKYLIEFLHSVAKARGETIDVSLDITDKLVAGVRADMKAGGVL